MWRQVAPITSDSGPLRRIIQWQSGREFSTRCQSQFLRNMAEAASEPNSKRVLEPIERISEVLFGIIMVLTFTGSLSVAEAGREDVGTMLITALGCNLAWGIIDGIMFLMSRLSEQAHNIRTLVAVR